MKERVQVCDFCAGVYRVVCPVCGRENEITEDKRHNSQTVHEAKIYIGADEANEQVEKPEKISVKVPVKGNKNMEAVRFTKPIDKEKLLAEIRSEYPAATVSIDDGHLSVWGEKHAYIDGITPNQFLELVGNHRGGKKMAEAPKKEVAAPEVAAPEVDIVSMFGQVGTVLQAVMQRAAEATKKIDETANAVTKKANDRLAELDSTINSKFVEQDKSIETKLAQFKTANVQPVEKRQTTIETKQTKAETDITGLADRVTALETGAKKTESKLAKASAALGG